MNPPNRIMAYLHCRKCGQQHLRSKLAIGLTLDGCIQVWCDRCNMQVANLPLRDPPEIAELICAECGQPFGPDHKHEHGTVQ